LGDRLPAEEMLHALEQRADAAAAHVGNGTVAVEGEGEFLVLGADAERGFRLAPRLEPGDELVAARNRRHVDLVAGHAAHPAKGPRTYTSPASQRKSRAVPAQRGLKPAPTVQNLRRGDACVAHDPPPDAETGRGNASPLRIWS